MIERMTARLLIYWILLISKKKKKKYSLIGINLCKQTKSKDPLQISFIGRLFSCTQWKNVFKKSSKNQKKLLLDFYKILQTYENGNSRNCKFVKQSG